MSYLIGRLTEEPKSEEGKVNITLAVTRSYKNADGIYETDFVPVVLFNGIATNTANYCHKGDLMAVRGRL